MWVEFLFFGNFSIEFFFDVFGNGSVIKFGCDYCGGCVGEVMLKGRMRELICSWGGRG